MAVNGIEIKVGQVWLCRDGRRVRIVRIDGIQIGYPVVAVGLCYSTYTACGQYVANKAGHAADLVDLIQEVPVELDAIYEHVRSAEELSAAASQDPVPQAVELQENTIFADICEDGPSCGRTKLSECYVEKKPGTSAPDLLDAAAGHMRDRAATYDKPEGERSIAQVVTAFNAIHGMQLTEAQGWHFMSLLKQVRAFAGKAHRDSVEDNVAYAALMGEAMLKGGAQ